MSFNKKIEELKIILPEAKPPVGSYVATKKSGNLLFISGQISIDENGELIGIMSGIFTKQSDTNVGVNFAISSELLIETISHLLK